MAALSEQSCGQTFFAVGDHHYAVAEIAAATVASMRGGRVTHVPWPAERKSIEMGKAVISNAKIRRMLGWSPTHSLEEGLAKTRAYYASCLGEYL